MLYRYFMPAYFLGERGHTVTMHPQCDSNKGEILTKDIKESDICIFGMAVYPVEVEVATMLKKNGKKIVYDSDDWYWDNKYVKFSKECHESTKKLALLADKVTVCSKSLGDLYIKHIGVKPENVQVIPNFVPIREWNMWYEKKREKRESNKTSEIVIGIMGASNHCIDWCNHVDIWLEIKEKYGNRVKFEIMGFPEKIEQFISHNKDILSSEGERAAVMLYGKLKKLKITFVPRTLKMEEFYPKMCSLGWDIGISTLDNCRTDKGKSFLKYEDYGMARIPAVYTGIPPLTEAVVDGFNGLLANSHDEWINQISRLVEDKDLRDTIKNNAVRDIESKYDIETNGIDLYEKVYKSIL